jgi:nucleotide-binding universal stress UspA family protein
LGAGWQAWGVVYRSFQALSLDSIVQDKVAGEAMYKKIIVAYNESPEASRALAAAIRLAKLLHSELCAVVIFQPAVISTSFASAISSPFSQTLIDDQRSRYEQLLADARELALKDGVDLDTNLFEGKEVEEIVGCLNRSKADLLVIGIRQHSLYVSRLWSSVYEIALDAPCSVLGVH